MIMDMESETPMQLPRSGRERRKLLQGIALGAAYLSLPRSVLAMGSADASAHITPLVSKKRLARQLEQEFKLSRQAVEAALAQASFIPSVIQRIERPYEARPYRKYRPLFVNKRLARMGKAYMKKHGKIFGEAMHRYGVQPEIIAAILGMETHYGRSRGKDRVLDSLYTLSVGYPKRATFFRKQLGEFLMMTQEEHLKPETLLGSYAGAFGATQFIPSSYRSYAVDADGDGRRDVWDSPADIINSVANYFHRHGWQAGKPVAYWLPHIPDSAPLARIRKGTVNGIHKWHTLAQLQKQGLPPVPDMWHSDDRVTLLDFDTASGPATALVHHNFYVITRWNRAYNYAMAATELAFMLGCDTCRNHA
jgi:membrane-bound lytic murein transglycosylase B